MTATTTPGGQVELRTCWSEIGVHGDGSCAELKKFVHCRNCPVYSNAGAQLLNRPLPSEYRREWTEHVAGRRRTAAPAKISAVLFPLESAGRAPARKALQQAA